MTNPLLKRARSDILKMLPYSSARSIHKVVPGSIFLDANECPFEPYLGAENLAAYPEQQPETLVQGLSKLYDVSTRNLVITRGADEAIEVLIRTFCISNKDNIIICPPTFAMYSHSAAIHGVKVKEVPLLKTFELDIDNIKATSDKNTKLIFLCSPNNPTGNLMNVEKILTLCEWLKDHAVVVVDETYIEFAGESRSIIPHLENVSNLVVIRTLSKAYAAAGIRCGVSISHSDIASLIKKILPPYPIPQTVVHAVVKLLVPENLNRLDRKRYELLDRKDTFIQKLRLVDEVEEIYPSDTNYVLVKFVNSSSLIKRCISNNIFIRDVSHQSALKNCVRISIGNDEDMTRLLATIQNKKIPKVSEARISSIHRVTSETSVTVQINLDEQEPVNINTGIGFYDHMLEQVAKHGNISLELECQGDLHIDMHHTIEDCAIALGQAIKKALRNKLGVARYGFTVPMDETLATAAIDLSGRYYLKFGGKFPDNLVGGFPTDMVEHVFRSFAENLGATLHISVEGENTHHMVEACFKALGRALGQAIKCEGNNLPSTKGIL